MKTSGVHRLRADSFQRGGNIVHTDAGIDQNQPGIPLNDQAMTAGGWKGRGMQPAEISVLELGHGIFRFRNFWKAINDLKRAWLISI